MDYPKSTPGVGLVGGKFADENPTTGQIGSLIPAGWGNSVTDEILAVIKAANLVPDETDRLQLSKAIAALIAAPSGAAAGTYTQVRINARGVVVEGNNPTTVAGYGITDAIKAGFLGLAGKTTTVSTIDTIGLQGGFHAFTSGVTTFGNYVSVLNFPYTTETQAAQLGFKFSGEEPQVFIRSTKAASAWGNTRELWHSGNFTPSGKADKATTLAGYGIADAYTKPQVDTALAGKAGNATTLAGYGIADAYTKTQADTLLAAKAAKATTLGGYGITDAYTKSQVDAALADPWALQPVGVPIAVFDGASSALAPPKGKAYRYIRLTAADAAYNDDLLTGEVVSGSAPLVNAYATISLAGSLLNNSIVRLINTERRFLRAGAVGTIEADQFQGFTLPAGTGNGSNGPAFDSWANGAVNTTKTPLVTDGVNGTPRTGTETRPKNVGVTYYMRVL